MKLLNYKYHCMNCESYFKAPQLPGEPYGEFLLRTKNGEIAYLFAIESTVFSDVGDIVDAYLEQTDVSDLGKAIVLHQLFGLACDLSDSGEEYKIGRNPSCPKCGENYKLGWQPTDPFEIVEFAVKEVTHERWNKLANDEKKTLIERAIEPLLAQKSKFGII